MHNVYIIPGKRTRKKDYMYMLMMTVLYVSNLCMQHEYTLILKKYKFRGEWFTEEERLPHSNVWVIFHPSKRSYLQHAPQN